MGRHEAICERIFYSILVIALMLYVAAFAIWYFQEEPLLDDSHLAVLEPKEMRNLTRRIILPKPTLGYRSPISWNSEFPRRFVRF